MAFAPSDPTLTPQQVLDLDVYALAYGGEGIARHQGMVIFIPGALPGDRVRARVQSLKKRFARAETETLLSSSEARVPPSCPLAGTCGGCSWQHLSYPAQLKAKQTFVENALQHIGRLRGVTVEPVIKATPVTGYRHKVQIPIQAGEEGLRTGFYARQTHVVAPLEDCPVQPTLANRLFRAARDLARQFGWTGYDERRREGQLRHVVVRVGLNTREALLTVVSRDPQLPGLADWAAELQRAIPELAGVVHNINPASTNVILGRDNRVVAGRGYYHEEIRGLRYRISAESFFQVNPYQLPALAEAVLAAAGLTGRETVADLYCGVGFLTLELARQARLAVGIETVPAAVDDALANKHLNPFPQVDFLARDALQGLDQLAGKGFMPDVVSLDPPRKGLDPLLLRRLLAIRPKRIVYVSCNPVTLARDLALLAGGGYRITSVQPVDLFPHTYHIETVVGLTHKK